MATYSFEMDGDNVKLASSTTNDARGAPIGNLVCTGAQFEEFKSKSAQHPGTAVWRWTYINSVLAEVTDTRRVGTWSPDGDGEVVDGAVVYDLDLGSTEPTVTLTITPGSISGEQLVVLDRIGPIKVTASNGVATIAIKTDVARKFEVRSSDLLQLANPLRVRVSALKI